MAKAKRQPLCIVIAGPNGAGKTTFARRYLPENAGVVHFVNADLIAGGLSPLKPELASIAAARTVLREVDRMVGERMDFAFETTLSGLMYAEEGQVLWAGRNIRDNLQGYHSDLAYIGHEPPLKIDFTATENLHYWLGIRWPVSRAQIDQALERVGAITWSDRPIRTLSAGQKRRVALAGLTLMAVPVWLLDEPTTNLDREGQHLVGTLIEEHLERGGLAVAAIHHELSVRATALRRLELARE